MAGFVFAVIWAKPAQCGSTTCWSKIKTERWIASRGTHMLYVCVGIFASQRSRCTDEEGEIEMEAGMRCPRPIMLHMEFQTFDANGRVKG